MKLTKPLAFVDIESTGVDPSKDRIVTLAALVITPTNTTEKLDIICNPGVPMSPEVIEIHGITNEMVADEKPFSHYAALVHEFLAPCDLAGYGVIGFDIPLLAEEFDRCDIEWDLSDTQIIDVCNIFKKKEPRDLTAALKFFCGRDHEGAHGALADVMATRDVLEGQLNRYSDLPQNVAELAKWSHMDDRVDLAGKFIRKNGVVCYGFGKLRGQPVKDNPSLAEWLLSKDFTANTKMVARKLLEEIYRGEESQQEDDVPFGR